MTFEEAFDNAVRAWYSGKGFDEYENKTGNKIKYSKSYLDSMEKDITPKNKKEDK